jgi:hypothetical protein
MGAAAGVTHDGQYIERSSVGQAAGGASPVREMEQ